MKSRIEVLGDVTIIIERFKVTIAVGRLILRPDQPLLVRKACLSVTPTSAHASPFHEHLARRGGGHCVPPPRFYPIAHRVSGGAFEIELQDFGGDPSLCRKIAAKDAGLEYSPNPA